MLAVDQERKYGYDDPRRGPRKPFAIVNKHDTVLFLSLARDEESIWIWYLGWPDESDIADAKAKGLRCVLVDVTVNK